MDIGAVSMALAQSKLTNDFGVAMLGKALDTQEVEGAGLVQMIDSAAMERSVNPSVGGNFDMSV